MISNYATIAWRNLQKRLWPTVINISGLAVGLAACILIGLWVQKELSYDTFHPGADRIHRIVVDYRITGDQAQTTPMAPLPLGPTLSDEVPEVERVTRIQINDKASIHHRDQTHLDVNLVTADSTFFGVFAGFEFVHGSPGSVLEGSGDIVLTESTAQRIFGQTNVVGETLLINGATQQVTGVMRDVPEASHLQFDAVSYRGRAPDLFEGNWAGFNFVTYAQLREGADLDSFQSKLADLADRFGARSVAEAFELPVEQIHYELFAQPLPRIHLYSDLDVEVASTGSIETVYTFAAIGFFVMLIACINFMNLATARASERAIEVGMRKALGAGRRQLAVQFLGEALLTTAAAALLAVGVAAFSLPIFNDLAGTSVDLAQLFQGPVLLGVVLLVLFVGMISGSYPAFALSRFQPASVLKASGRHSSGSQGRRFRQSLVVLQFAVSITLIVGTLVAWQQFDYIQNKPLGLEQTHVVEIDRASVLGARQTTFMDRVEQLPGVVSAGASTSLFGELSRTSFLPSNGTSDDTRPLNFYHINPAFLETMKIDVVGGRAFDISRTRDSVSVMLNEAGARAFGWTPQEAIGRSITVGAEAPDIPIIGVVENFHYQSMRSRVKPLALFLVDPLGSNAVPASVYVRLEGERTPDTIGEVRSVWESMAGQEPFRYAYLDQTFARLHDNTERAGNLLSIFAGIGIIIACLGLFGLATYTVQRRAKEIGIRKALGASVAQVVGLLSREFIQLVGLAAFLGLPVAYLAMQRWLSEFAYRMDLGVGVFVMSVVLACLMAVIAISYQALRAARLDPAQTLQDE